MHDDLFSEIPASFRKGVPEFLEFWNSKLYMPKIRGTPRQARLIGLRCRSPYFQKNYQEAIELVGRSKFLRGSKGFVISLDWFLIPDNFDKLLEGKYSDQPHKNTIKPQNTFIDEYGNEQII